MKTVPVIKRTCTCQPGPGCPHVTSGQNHKQVIEAQLDHVTWLFYRDALRAMQLPATADMGAS